MSYVLPIRCIKWLEPRNFESFIDLYTEVSDRDNTIGDSAKENVTKCCVKWSADEDKLLRLLYAKKAFKGRMIQIVLEIHTTYLEWED